MWDALSTLYQGISEQRKMYPKKLRLIWMQKGEGINPYLTRIQEFQDQLSTVGAMPQPTELVRLVLNSVVEDWQGFVQSILGQEKLPEWDRMSAKLQHEELRRALLKSSMSSSELKIVKEEKNVALASKGLSQGQQEQRKKKKDMSMVKCFRCGELGNYSTECHLRKKDKEEKQDQQETSTEIDRLSAKLEENFAMFANIPPGVRWGDLALQSHRIIEIGQGS